MDVNLEEATLKPGLWLHQVAPGGYVNTHLYGMQK
jgi:hypothetical protein